jgi:hypothetical protein
MGIVNAAQCRSAMAMLLRDGIKGYFMFALALLKHLQAGLLSKRFRGALFFELIDDFLIEDSLTFLESVNLQHGDWLAAKIQFIGSVKTSFKNEVTSQGAL